METTFFFKKMTQAGSDKVQQYVGKKLPRLSRLTAKYPQDGVVLHVTAQKFERNAAFEVEFVLRILSKKFAAKEDSHTLTKAVDMAFDKLISQIKKAKKE